LNLSLDSLKDEVLKKIGRNMLLFQQMEHQLKYLLSNNKLSGSVSDIEVRKAKRNELIHKQTMGSLVGQLVDEVYSNTHEEAEFPVDIEEPHLAFSFKMEMNPADLEAKKKTLATIVDSRNDLIHHMLPRLIENTMECWTAALHYLEGQHEKLLPEITSFKNIIQTLQKSAEISAAFAQSDEFEKYMELTWLQESELIKLIWDIANQATLPGGWVSLSKAGREIRARAPGEMETIHERFGHKKLIDLINASELFEVRDELIPKGGMRKLYRIKPVLNLEKS
jgi:hypothetical protein